MNVNKLECMKLFTHVARVGSFTLAANELNMTQGAISKKIARLESELGFVLFHRTSRKISLTDTGKRYLDYCHNVIEQMIATEQELKNELREAVGHMKISAPSAFATQHLAKPISIFLQQYPNITINISVNDKQANLYEEDIDVAIRASFLEDSSLKARKLIEHELCYFASPEYLNKNSTPIKSADIVQHVCITYSLSNPSNIWYLDEEKYLVKEVVTTDSPEMIVRMALLGQGIAAMPRWMVKKYFDRGSLIELFPGRKTISLPMYAVYRNTEFTPYRIRAFIDFLVSYYGNDEVFGGPTASE